MSAAAGSMKQLRDTVITSGQFKDRLVSSLDRSELKKVAASRSQAAESKLWLTVARARLAMAELAELDPATVLPSPVAAEMPPSCTVLALHNPGKTAPRQAPPRANTQGTPRLRYLRLLLPAAIALLAYPQLAAIPAYVLGWIVRATAARAREVVVCFMDTFRKVLGDLWLDAVEQLTPSEAVQTHMGGVFFSGLIFYVMHRG